MDILGLLKNLLSSENAETLAPIIELLRENSFDLKKTVNSVTPEKLVPIIEKLFIKHASNGSGFNAEFKAGGVTTVANIADGEIVYALNKYLSATS